MNEKSIILAGSKIVDRSENLRIGADWTALIDVFLDTLDSGSTRATYARTLRKLPMELGGNGPREISARDLAEWRAILIERLEAGDIAPATVKRELMTVRSFFRFCHLLRQSNITADVRKMVLRAPNGDAQKPFVVLSTDEQRALLSSLSGVQRRAIAIMLLAGLRVSETCALTKRDYFANGDGLLWLRIRPEKSKGKKARNVPVSAALADILGKPETGDSALLRSRKAGRDGKRHFSRVRLWQILRKGLERAIPDRADKYSPHSLRHTAAMRWLDARVPLPTIQKWLGHASLATTQCYLAHQAENDAHALMP